MQESHTAQHPPVELVTSCRPGRRASEHETYVCYTQKELCELEQRLKRVNGTATATGGLAFELRPAGIFSVKHGLFYLIIWGFWTEYESE